MSDSYEKLEKYRHKPFGANRNELSMKVMHIIPILANIVASLKCTMCNKKWSVIGNLYVHI